MKGKPSPSPYYTNRYTNVARTSTIAANTTFVTVDLSASWRSATRWTGTSSSTAGIIARNVAEKRGGRCDLSHVTVREHPFVGLLRFRTCALIPIRYIVFGNTKGR